MERQDVIRELEAQIENLATLHIRHGLQHSEGFRKHKESVKAFIRENKVDVKKELDLQTGLLYRRYFD